MTDSLWTFPQSASGSSVPVVVTNGDYTYTGSSLPREVDGCSECNRGSEPKPWPAFVVNYHGTEVCAKCLTPMNAPRRPRV